MSQVKIPKSVNELADLVTKIEVKSTADGDQSILKPAINMEGISAKVAQMLDCQGRADEANRLKEEMNEQKNKLARDIKKDVQQIRTLLKAHFPDEMRKLGAWGFTIDNVVKKKVEEPV